MKKSYRKELPYPVGRTERGESEIYGRGCLWCFLSTLLNGGIAEGPGVQRAPDTHKYTHTHRESRPRGWWRHTLQSEGQLPSFTSYYFNHPFLNHFLILLFFPTCISVFKCLHHFQPPLSVIRPAKNSCWHPRAESEENWGIPFYSFGMTLHVDACFFFSDLLPTTRHPSVFSETHVLD